MSGSGFVLGEPSPITTTRSADDAAPDEMAAFLRRVLPVPGVGRALGIHYADQSAEAAEQRKQYRRERNLPEDGDKTGMPGRAFHSVDDAVMWLKRWQGLSVARGAPHVDFYVAMALCGMEVKDKDRKGREIWRATRRRVAMVTSRALFADIDIGKGPDSYPDKQSALDHMAALVAAGSLPSPTVILNSGRGLHLHWILDREVGPAEWYSLGPAFSGYLKSLGVQHDPAITSDAVRVLRLPNTYNCKDLANPLATSLVRPMDPADIPVATFERLLSLPPIVTNGLQGSAPTPSPTPALSPSNVVPLLPAAFKGAAPLVPVTPGPSEFSAGITLPAPVDFPTVMAHCPTLSDIHARHGAGDSGSLWRLALLAASFAENGRHWAHELSKGHAAYTPADTDSTFDARIRAQQTGTGWPQCKTFSIDSPACAACKRLDFGKSPLNLPTQASAGAATTTPTFSNTVTNTTLLDGTPMPAGYFFVGDTLCTTKSEPGANGAPADKTVHVLPYRISDAFIEQANGGAQLNMGIVHVMNPPTRLVVHTGDVTAWREGAMDALKWAGVTLQSEEQQLTKRFLVSFIRTLQNRAVDSAQRDAYGWTKLRDGSDGFAYAGEIYNAAGTVETAPVGDTKLAEQYTPTGTLDKWLPAAQAIIASGRIDLSMILATAFAAPLMRFTGQAGVTVSFFSADSGTQKSSAMQVAQAVWGNPRAAISKMTDTANHINRKLGQLRHLPVYWDELIKKDQTEAFVNNVFQLTLGTEKGRLSADSQFKESGSWATMLVVASNPGLRQGLLEANAGSAAGVLRVLEIEVKRVDLTHSSAAQASTMIAQTHENFGHVGRLYAALLAREQATLATKVQRVATAIEANVQARNEERYWVFAAATMIVGMSLANTLRTDAGQPVIQFDLRAATTFLLGVIKGQRVRRDSDIVATDSDEFAADMLTGFIDACRIENTVLETDIMLTTPGRHSVLPQLNMTTAASINMLKVPFAHIAKDDRRIRVNRARFRKWLGKEHPQHSFEVVLNALRRHAGMNELRAMLAAGTHWKQPKQDVLEFDVSMAADVGKYFDESLSANTGAAAPAPTPTPTPAATGTPTP